jgi:hypothetical protein
MTRVGSQRHRKKFWYYCFCGMEGSKTKCSRVKTWEWGLYPSVSVDSCLLKYDTVVGLVVPDILKCRSVFIVKGQGFQGNGDSSWKRRNVANNYRPTQPDTRTTAYLHRLFLTEFSTSLFS